MRKRTILLSLVLALLLGLTACVEEDPPASSPPDVPSVVAPLPTPPVPVEEEIPLTLPYDPTESFHPSVCASQVDRTLFPLMYEGLFRLDETMRPEKQLCSDYQVSENGLTWTFDLRDDVTFSDGTALTAAAAAQSLELARGADGWYAGRLAGIVSVTANRSGQLVIVLSRPNGDLPALLDVPVVLGRGNRPLGTGPYVLVEDEEEEGQESTARLVLRGDRQADERLGEEIPLAAVDGQDQLIHAFDGGRVALVDTDFYGTGAPGFSAACERAEYITTGMVFLGFNTTSTYLRTAQARRAVEAVLDREALTAEAYGGHAQAVTLPVCPVSPLYDGELAEQLRPESTAEELIAAAKLADRTLTLLVNSENNARVKAAELIAAQLEEAGIHVTLSRLGWSDYLTALEGGKFDLYLAEVNLSADFDLSPLVESGGALNYSRRSSRDNKDTDALLESFRAAGGEEREEAAKVLYAHLAQEVPITPLCFRSRSVLTQWGQLTGLTPIWGNVFYTDP